MNADVLETSDEKPVTAVDICGYQRSSCFKTLKD
jgi:hypothetical protein